MKPKLLTLAISLLAALQLAPSGSARPFRAGTNYPSGEFPVAAVVRDFNNDGISDIASANQNDKNVSIFLGNGDGTFAPASTLTPGAGAVEIASADLNADGNLDLVVTDGIKSAYVVLGNGDGTFGSPTKVSLHTDPIGIAIADLNADGILDLAIAIHGPETNSNGEVAILIGIGARKFAPPVYYGLTHNGIRLTAVDLNHDGKLDLVVAVQHFSSPKNALAVLLGNGDGTFQPVMTSISGSGTDVAVADFDADGNVDLALSGDAAVRVALGNGDGTFQPVTSYSTKGSAGTVTAADLDGDGRVDLLVGGSGAAVLLGDGSGGFAPAVLYGVGEVFARIGYFNGDHIPDVVAKGGFSEIEVAFGRPRGAFNAPLVYPVGYNGFDAADFDGDGHADVVVGDGSTLYFVHGEGDGTLGEAVPFASLQAKTLTAADFDGDGNRDILAAPFSGPRVYIILGNGDGTFQPALAISVSTNSFYGFDAVVSDLNHDGKADVALTDFTSDSLLILLGNGDGTFEESTTYKTPDGPQQPTVADFNLDGNIDLATSQASASDYLGFGYGFSIYLGDGNGSFSSPMTTQLQGALAVIPGDLNGDGKPDLTAGGDGVKVLLGNGDGTFGTPATVYPNFDFGWVRVADIDLDDRLDVIVRADSTFAVLRGQGNGTFRQTVEFAAGTQSGGEFVLRDLNGDNTPDVILTDRFDSLSVFLNTSRPQR